MRIYLAARYSRRLELCEYRQQLEGRGHEVTSRWLNGGHQISDVGVPLGDDGERLVESGGEKAKQLTRHFANEDVSDVISAELLIHFTEEPRAKASRGGRHVEMGIAIGRGTPVIVVGYRENIFCWLDRGVEFVDTWADVLRMI